MNISVAQSKWKSVQLTGEYWVTRCGLHATRLRLKGIDYMWLNWMRSEKHSERVRYGDTNTRCTPLFAQSYDVNILKQNNLFQVHYIYTVFQAVTVLTAQRRCTSHFVQIL